MDQNREKIIDGGRLAAYCAKAIKNAGNNAYKFVRLHQQQLLSLSQIPDNSLDFSYYEKYLVTESFGIQRALKFAFEDDLTKALLMLDPVRQEIVLRKFAYRETEQEIAKALHMTRNNVHYHKKAALDLLRMYLEKEKNG